MNATDPCEHEWQGTQDSGYDCRQCTAKGTFDPAAGEIVVTAEAAPVAAEPAAEPPTEE